MPALSLAIALALALAQTAGLVVRPSCAALVAPDGRLDLGADLAPIADLRAHPHPRCQEGAAIGLCCRRAGTLPCDPSLVAEPTCCAGNATASRTWALLAFELGGAAPFSSASLELVHECHPSDPAACSAAAGLALSFCEEGSCTAGAPAARCSAAEEAPPRGACGAGPCRLSRDVTAAVGRALSEGRTKLIVRLEPLAPTRLAAWPEPSLCARAGASCEAAPSSPYTSVRLLPSSSAPALAVERACSSSVDCRPGSSWECVEGACGECSDGPGLPCYDREGREGRCCGGACATLPFEWTDSSGDGLATAGVDRCGAGPCRATLACTGGAWRCASQGRACCDGAAASSCDGSGSCASGAAACPQGACSAGSCAAPCGDPSPCPPSEHCSELGGSRTCRRLCSSAGGCSGSEPCVDTNANGGIDTCGPCALEGARCAGPSGPGFCCGGACLASTLADTDADGRLTPSDACGAGPCSGRAACSLGPDGSSPSWSCSSEGSACCSGPSRGRCAGGGCAGLTSCSPGSCGGGRCTLACTGPADCSGGAVCAGGLCASCAGLDGLACSSAQVARGRCCALSCSAVSERGGPCELDCQCQSGLGCEPGLGICLGELGSPCASGGACDSGCCAGGMCRRGRASGPDGPCAADCECAGGLACGGGRCRRATGAPCAGAYGCATGCCAGGLCAEPGLVGSGGTCFDGCQCEGGFACGRRNATDALGACLAAQSGACSADGACATGCCARGSCVPARTVARRGPCSSSCQCSVGSRCTNGTCLVPVGLPCGSGWECETGVCLNATCRERGDRALGEQCSIHNECLAGLECAGGRCLLVLGSNSTAGGRCASGCASGGLCARPAELPLGSACTHSCACSQGMACGASGRCLMPPGGQCQAHAACEGGCCVHGRCASFGALSDGRECGGDCQCASGVCAAGLCSASRPCRASDDCAAEAERRVCAGGVCRARCEPDGARCDAANATGWCCRGSCTDLPPRLAPSSPGAACGEGACSGTVACSGDGWGCSSAGGARCSGGSAGTCSERGTFVPVEECRGRCEGLVAAARTCRDGRCEEGGRTDCAPQLKPCRDGACAACRSDAECAPLASCNGTTHVGYGCAEGSCRRREARCDDSQLVCTKAGCAGCAATSECEAQYGPGRSCDTVLHLCRALACTRDGDCAGSCEGNVHVEAECVDGRCKEGDKVPCSAGEVCAPQGCQGCSADDECILHYGLDHTCRDGRCRRTCGDGRCDAAWGEDCGWCPDCACNAPVLCDPASAGAQAGGCVPDADADRVPDDEDTDPSAPGAPCEGDEGCPPVCRRALAVRRACVGGQCAPDGVEDCGAGGQVCSGGRCAPCRTKQECRLALGPLRSCAAGACRSDVDGDGAPDVEDGCPRDPSRAAGCQPEEGCGRGTDCRSSPYCACPAGRACEPHRRGADEDGCAEVRCGDGLCDRPAEGERTCCPDCGCLRRLICENRTRQCSPGCGDGVCEALECRYCREDCGPESCRDGQCEPAVGEDSENSPDCVLSLDVFAPASAQSDGSGRAEVAVQVTNTGRVPASFVVRARGVNARVGAREVVTPTVRPGGSHAFMLPVELTDRSEGATVELSISSASAPELAAHRTVSIERSGPLFFERVFEGTILAELMRGTTVPALAAAVALAVGAVGLGVVLLVKAGTRLRRPRTVAGLDAAAEAGAEAAPQALAQGYASYYAASAQAGWSAQPQPQQGWEGEQQGQ